MSRATVATFLALGAVALAMPSSAATITIVHPFSSIVSLAGFPEFDPALGTVDEIGVEIGGTLLVSTLLTPLQSIQPIIDFDASGAGGRGFAFAGSGARFILPGATNATTFPELRSFATTFTLAFTIDALSDLTGVVIASTSSTSGALIPPVSVEARRSDFIAGLAPIGVNETLIFSPIGFTPTTLDVNGAITLTYTYTPAPSAVPAAGAAALIAALPLLLLRRRR